LTFSISITWYMPNYFSCVVSTLVLPQLEIFIGLSSFHSIFSSFTMPSTTAVATATKKRKTDATSSAATKKAKLVAAAHAETVESILSDAKNFELPYSPAMTRKMIVELAQYARSLEAEVAATKPKVLSPAELEAAAEKLANAARSGIRKQLTVSFLWKHKRVTLKFMLRQVEAVRQNWECEVDVRRRVPRPRNIRCYAQPGRSPQIQDQQNGARRLPKSYR